ncbi:mucin-5AC isoform X2 [Dermacentor silvarum]|uniref:mucin-5AC isoform X2 n=1 Tax=Dermacentor silvarum TaxID=543639 RepID=UPI002101A10A|nr:mucin-5AC isoform X2 [Dermacentor silvarum]
MPRRKRGISPPRLYSGRRKKGKSGVPLTGLSANCPRRSQLQYGHTGLTAMTTRLLAILLSLSAVGMPLPYGKWPFARDISRLRSTCVEGENFVHPRGDAYYLTCTDGALRQRWCGVDRLFSTYARKCVNARTSHPESGTIQRLPSPGTVRLEHERRYLRSPTPSGRGAQSINKTRTKLIVNDNNAIYFKKTEKREKAVPDKNAFIEDFRYERLQDIRPRPQQLLIVADRRRSDMARSQACVGCFRKRVLPVAEKVKSPMVTRSSKRSSLSNKFSVSTRTTRGNSRSSISYISSPKYKRRIEPSRPLSYTRSPTPLKENRSLAVSPTVELLRTLPTVRTRKVFPAASTPVNFKSTRKKCFRTTKFLSSIADVDKRTRSTSLPSQTKPEALKPRVSASEHSTANVGNDAADINAVQEDVAINHFITTTASYKQSTHDSAEDFRSVASPKVETSEGPERNKNTAQNRSGSIETVHMSLVENTPAVTHASLNGENLAPPSTSGSNPSTSSTRIVITESSVLITEEEGRINSSEDSLQEILVSENMRDAPLEVEQQQDDVRTKTDVSSTAIYAKTEAALQHSSEDVTNASGGETAGPEQALKPKEIEGSSGDSTSSQNEPSLTGLVHKRTTISLQVPGADKYEQSFEGKIHVRLNPPLPFQPSTQASLETVSQDSSGEATPVELTTNTATQQSLNKQGSSTERSSSKDVDASDTFAKLSESEQSTVLTLTGTPKTTAHRTFSSQKTPSLVMSSVEQRDSAESRSETTSTIAAATGPSRDQNTQGETAGFATASVSTISEESNKGKLKVAFGSSVKTRAGIREDEETTLATERTDATIALPMQSINTPYTESYSGLSTENEGAFVSLYTATNGARPHTSEDLLKKSLPVFTESVLETTLIPYAPSDLTDLPVSTLPSPYLATRPAELTDRKYKDTPGTPSSMQMQDEALERVNQAQLKWTLTKQETTPAADHSSTDHSQGYYEANKVNYALPSTVGITTMLTLLTVQKSYSLPSPVTVSYTATRSEPHAAIKTGNATQGTTTVSAPVVSPFPEKPVTGTGGEGTQSTNIFYPSNTSSQEAPTSQIYAALFTDNTSPYNDNLTAIVTSPTLYTSIDDVKLITITETTTQKTKPQASQTEVINDFETKVNAVMTMLRNDTENVAPLNQLTETNPISNVSTAIRDNLNVHSNKRGLVESQKNNDSSSDTADKWFALTNTVSTSMVSTSEAYGHHTPIAINQELATTGYVNQVDTTQTSKDVESSQYSPTIEGNRLFFTESLTFEDGPDADTEAPPHITSSNRTSERAVLKKSSTKTSFTDATTRENETEYAYSTIVEDFQEDVHDASLSLSELHLSKSSGRSRLLNPSITVHLSTRYYGEINGATETTSDTSTATSEEVRTAAATNVTGAKTLKTSTKSPQFFTEKVLPQEVESPKSSEEHLPFKATVDTNAHFKAEASIQDPESPTTMLFGPPSDTEKEQTEGNRETDESVVSTPVASPSSTVISPVDQYSFSTVSEEGSSTTSDKTSSVRPQVTTKMGEYATIRKKALVTLGTAAVAATITSAAISEKAKTWATLSIPSSRLQEKTTKAPLCKSTFGLFRHPTNCNLFVHCSNSVAFIKKCPANLHFNEEIMVCDWPYRAGCLSNAS